jgi:hypothetical protein
LPETSRFALTVNNVSFDPHEIQAEFLVATIDENQGVLMLLAGVSKDEKKLVLVRVASLQ